MELDETKVNEIIKDTAYAVSQATKSEVSGLLGQFKKDVQTIKEHLTEQDINMQRFEPMIRAFNDSENKKMVWGKFGIEIKNKSMFIAVVGSALAIIWGILKFGIKYLLK